MTAGITVLIADDEPDLLFLTHSLLEAAGFEVVDQAIDGEAALAAIERLDPPPIPTVVVLDHRMPGLTGLEVAERVLALHPDQRIVLFTAFLDSDLQRAAAAIGVHCVSKSKLSDLPKVVAALAEG